MRSHNARQHTQPSNLLALVGQPMGLVAQVRDVFKTMRAGAAARARQSGNAFAMEPMEPRVLLSADITYTYSAADVLHFNDGDLQNNQYTVRIADVGGNDFLQVLAEDASVLAQGQLVNDGVNKLTLTGNKFLGDQFSVDFTNIAGQTGADPRYDIQILTDGKGVIPLVGQDDKVTIVGDGTYQLHSLDLQSKEDVNVTGKVIATGDISLKSSATDNEGVLGNDSEGNSGLYFSADSAINVSGANARLEGANISLHAESSLAITNSNFSPGDVNIAFAVENADANINISGGVIQATGNITAEAKNTVTSTLTTVPNDANDDDDTVDAAVASAVIMSDTGVNISGGTIHADGDASFKSTNNVTASTTADGLTGDKGGTVAFTLFVGDTDMIVTGGTIDADSISMDATSVRNGTTLSRASVGGSNSGGGNNQSEKRLNDPNKDGNNSDKAKTGDGSGGGDVTFAAAVAVGVATGDTTASITGGSVHATSGDLSLTASGKLTMTTTADGSTKTGGGTAVGVGVAINVATSDVSATLGGTADVDGTNVKVLAEVPESKVSAVSISGAGGSNLGVAGSLAIGVNVMDANASLSGTPNANGANVSITAKSTIENDVSAKSKVDNNGGATGVGASVAVNVSDNDTHAKLTSAAAPTNIHDLSLSAQSNHSMKTETQAGTAGGDISVSPVVAISIANYDTLAKLETGATLTVGGALSVDATHNGRVNTLADGTAGGSSVAVGAVIAFNYAKDTVVATTDRDVVASSGAVSFTSSSIGQISSRAKASASGGNSSDPDSAQGESNNKRSAGNDRANTEGAGNATNDGNESQAEAPGSSSGSGSSIAVAAAISVNIAKSESRAEVPSGRIITAGGALTIRSKSNVDGLATADASAMDGSVGVGAAVGVNTVDVQNTAKLGTASVTADGLTVEATMADRRVDLQTAQIPVVDTDKETIFLGAGNNIATGQKVTYNNGGGTSIGGLSNGDYYARNVGGGKIELYDTKAHAEDEENTTGRKDLSSGATGTTHTIKPDGEDAITFDPTAQVRIMDVGENNGFSTGDEVVYHQGAAAPPVGGLTDGHTYYIISLDDTHVQLADSREHAMKGTAVTLSSDDTSDDDFLTESIHTNIAKSTSGAGGDSAAVAGSVAVNRAAVVTLAQSGGNVTLQDGFDVGSGIGDLKISAKSVTRNESHAVPEGKGAVSESVGVGASFALNLTFHDTTASVLNGSSISGSAGNITVEAIGTHESETEARNGAKGSTGVGGAVAVFISDNDTLARIGSSATGLSTSGAFNLTATHSHTMTTKASSEAEGDSASVGISVGVSWVTDSNNVQLDGRNVTSTGAATLRADLSLTSVLDVHASAKGGDSSDSDDADQQAGNKTNNTSTAGGGHTDGNANAGNSADSANSSSSSESGSGGSGVGVAASVAFGYINVANGAAVLNGADIDASGALTISAQQSVDAKAQADSTAVTLQGDVDVGAAVAFNFVSLDNTATVSDGSTVKGNGLTLEAVTTGSNRNDYVATAYTASGNSNGSAAVSGAIAINVIDVDTQAIAKDGSTLRSTGDATITAEHTMGLQAVAASGAVAGDGTGVGGAVAINIVGTGSGGSSTIAAIGDPDGDDSGATVQASGAVSVSATHTIDMTGTIDLAPSINDALGHDDPSFDIGTLAVAGAGGGGGSGIAGSVAINVLTTSTMAYTGRGSVVEGFAGGAAKAGSLSVTATDTFNWTSVVGSLGVGLSGSGVGAGLDLAIINKNTQATIGRGADVDVTGLVTVQTTSSEDILSVAANVGVGNSAGVAGSISVMVITTTSKAGVEASGGVAAATVHAGDVNIDAGGTLDLAMIAGSIGGGSNAGVGAAVTTLVHNDTVEAYIGEGATVIAAAGAHDITLNAHSTETEVAVGAAGGFSSTAGVAGSAVVNVLNETTRAYVDRNATVNAGRNLTIHADDQTKAVTVAGNLSISGNAAVGAGADVGIFTKHTDAFIESNVQSTIGGNIDVAATSFENITSVAAGIAASGTASVTVDASIHVLNVTTRSFIGDDPDNNGNDSAGAGDVHATGSISVRADEHTQVNAITGMLSLSGTAAVTAGGVVTVTNKNTAAFIGRGAHVTADGFTPVSSGTGLLAVTPIANGGAQGQIDVEGINGRPDADTLAGQGSVRSPSVSNSSTPTIEDGSGNDRPSNPNTDSSMINGAGVSIAPGSASHSGIALSATNYDQINGIGAGLAGSGGASVGLTAVVNAINNTTRAYVDQNAVVNSTDVIVGASNDLHHMAIAASLAVGVATGVAPAVGVTVITGTTEAKIVAGSTVNATAGDIVVRSNATEDILLVGAGIGGGTVGVGAGVSVLVVNNTTNAEVSGAVDAWGNVQVRSNDSTDITIVDGAAGVGLGGVGASVGVISLTKHTNAFVGDNAVVHARGNTSDTSALDGTLTGGNNATGFNAGTARGLVVEATSHEKVFHLNVALAGGFVGIAGGITVSVLNSDTHAYIGDADINFTGNSNASGQQDVVVNAANQAGVFTFAGGIAAGVGAAAGAVDVGVLRNNTNAEIQSGARVSAKDSVRVNALGIKNIDTIAASGAAGGVGLAGSVAVWTVGQTLSRNYTGDGGAPANPLDGGGSGTADGYATDQGGDGSSQLGSALNGDGGDRVGITNGSTDPNTAHTMEDRRSAIAYQSLSGTGGFSNQAPSSANLLGSLNNGPSVGTNAAIGGTAQVTTTTGMISVNAVENLHMTLTQGGVAIGLAGLGAGIGVVTIASNVSATAGGTLSAGGALNVTSSLYENVDHVAFAGAAGLLGLGAAVAMVNDNSTTTAGISDNAIVHNASNIDVDAGAEQHLTGNSVGIAVGAIGAGASFVKLNVDNPGATEVLAYVGDNVNIGQGIGDSVGGLTVNAHSTISANANAFGLSGGIIAATANFAFSIVTPEVIAKVGDGATGANIKLASNGDAMITSSLSGNIDAKTTGDTVGAFAGGLSKSTATLSPDIQSKAVKGTLTAHNLTMSAHSNVGAPTNYGADATAFAGAAGAGAAAGALTSATHNAATEVAVGSAFTIANSGDVLLSAIGNNKAFAKSTGAAGGVVGVGATNATAHTDGSTKAHLDGQVRNGGNTGAANLTIEAVSNDTSSATVRAVTGGLFAADVNGATATSNPTVEAKVNSGGEVLVGSNISINAESHTEADSVSTGVSISGAHIGLSTSTTTVAPTVSATLSATGGAVAGNSVTITANSSPVSGSAPTYQIVSTDTGNDTVHVLTHGLQTGDVVQISQSSTNIQADREYGVIVTSADDLAFGATMNGGPYNGTPGSAGVDVDDSTIHFNSDHDLETGDQIRYVVPGGSTGITGLTNGSTYYVIRIDGRTIRLADYDPIANPNHNLQGFTPTTGTTINLAGYSDNQAVTYHAPAAATFVRRQVDVTGGTSSGVVTLAPADNDNIQFFNTTEGDPNEGHPVSTGFNNGDLAVYQVSGGPAIGIEDGSNNASGSLINGATYRVGNVDNGNGTLQLHAYTTVSATFVNDGAGGNNDRITRSSGSWLDAGFRAGQTITISGTASNNATRTIASVSALTITLTSDNVITAEGPVNATFESSAIGLNPGASDDNATHSLTKPSNLPMTFFDGVSNVSADNRTFYVVNATPTSFSISLTQGGPALSLTAAAGATGNHLIGRENVGLRGTGAGEQQFRVNLTASVSGKLLGPGGVDLSVTSPASGNGISQAKSTGSAGGILFSGQFNNATTTMNPTVTASIGGQVRATNDVRVSGTVGTNGTSNSTNVSIGFIAIGEPQADIAQTVNNNASIDGRVVAGRDMTVETYTTTKASSSASAKTGGAVGIARAHATGTLNFNTKSTVMTGADVLAGRAVRVTADTSNDQEATATANGIGLGGDGHADATTSATGTTQAEEQSAASVTGKTALLAATISKHRDHATADGRGGGVYAEGTADTTDTDNLNANIVLGGSAGLKGTEGVDLRTKYSNVDVDTHAYGRSTGLFGYVSADGTGNYTFDSTVSGALNALVTAGPRDTSIASSTWDNVQRLLADVSGLDHLAFYVDTTNDPITTNRYAYASVRALAVWHEDTHGSTHTDRSIDFSSNVLILSGRSPFLEVDTGGAILHAVNVSVNDIAGGQSTRTSGTIVDGTIRVNNIINDDPGQAYFGGGATTVHTAGTGTWEFRDTFENVQIINHSAKPLQINDVHIVNTTVDPIVDLNNVDSTGFDFNILRTVKPTVVNIKGDSPTATPITINGVIENPIGTTHVFALHGDILAGGGRANSNNDPTSLIRTNILSLEAPDGNIGTGAARINVDVVDSANVPAPTPFISARVSSADNTIFLGENQFFTGELVKYHANGAVLGGLQNDHYYIAIVSSDGLSLQLADISDPNTPISITPTGTLTDGHSLTPAQHFTVNAGGDPASGKGNAYLDVKARLRDSAGTHQRAGVSDYSVIIDAVNTTGNADLVGSSRVDLQACKLEYSIVSPK